MSNFYSFLNLQNIFACFPVLLSVSFRMTVFVRGVENVNSLTPKFFIFQISFRKFSNSVYLGHYNLDVVCTFTN